MKLGLVQSLVAPLQYVCYHRPLHFIEKPSPTVHYHDLRFPNCDVYVDVASYWKHYCNVHFKGHRSQDWTLHPIQWSRFKYRRTKLPQSARRAALVTRAYLRARAWKHTVDWCPNYINMWACFFWVTRAMPAVRLSLILALSISLSSTPWLYCLDLGIVTVTSCLWMLSVWSTSRLTAYLGQCLSHQTS